MEDKRLSRSFKTFTYRDASYRISPADDQKIFDIITDRIITIREDLEAYIKRHSEFLTSLTPVELLPDAPEAARLMAGAARLAGTGPMAAVAGTTAQLAAQQTAETAGAGFHPEIIIENGGDIFILPAEAAAHDGTTAGPLLAGIFSGLNSKFAGLALRITPKESGIAVCSSSSRMGHSLSLGDCDLCTVVSGSAALADAAATLGCNLVKTESDLRPTAERLSAIDGIDGVLIIKNEQLAIAGKLPEIVKHKDSGEIGKITGTFLQ